MGKFNEIQALEERDAHEQFYTTSALEFQNAIKWLIELNSIVGYLHGGMNSTLITCAWS